MSAQNDRALAAIALAGGGTPKGPKPHGAVGLCDIPLAPVGLNWDELMANLYAIHRERMGRGTTDNEIEIITTPQQINEAAQMWPVEFVTPRAISSGEINWLNIDIT